MGVVETDAVGIVGPWECVGRLGEGIVIVCSGVLSFGVAGNPDTLRLYGVVCIDAGDENCTAREPPSNEPAKL